MTDTPQPSANKPFAELTDDELVERGMKVVKRILDELDNEPIVPMTDKEIEAIEESPYCPVCGGDGADLEDSSEDCYACRGTGLMSVYREESKR
jgi:hypothetical protein